MIRGARGYYHDEGEQAPQRPSFALASAGEHLGLAAVDDVEATESRSEIRGRVRLFRRTRTLANALVQAPISIVRRAAFTRAFTVVYFRHGLNEIRLPQDQEEMTS
ncbi:hypothetical protein AS026_32790 [Rhizobium altiplani]|uniref:Uncharacterized protein n=1 Tax=Rhizobium altiplani TaxID=1864509 RepID=A0A109JXQ8_9HYPH|nr:hypothetical protein AS026_32790 [Rhizobium altiplani]